MNRTITLRDARQGFAKYVREVEAGEEFLITRKGTPVARLVPVEARTGLSPRRAAALARTLARVEAGWDIDAGPFDRDALHER